MASPTVTALPPSAQHHRSLFAGWPVLSGIAVGLATLAPHALLSPRGSVGYAAVIVALIAGVYFGFAVMNGSSRDQLVEFNVTGLFALSGLLVIWRNQGLI